MKSHQVTIKDIARELGVSVSTVSRALKDHPDISPQTKKLVKELAERLHYKPNPIALSLRNQRTNIIGVIVPEIMHFFFSSVIAGIDEMAMSKGYNVMFFQSNEQYEREVLNVQTLINSRVDGVLLSLAKESERFGHIKQLIENNTPVVFFDRDCEEIQADKVIVDDFDGAMNAVEYLIKTGCKRIAHFAGPKHLNISYLRKRGYITALEKHGLEVDDDLIIKCDSYDQASVVTRELMQRDNRPDAIFTVNDLTAVGALNTIKGMGIKIPEDVSIIGFTDGLVSSVTDPLLTTVSQHGFEIGQKSAELLIKRIESNEENYKPVTEIVKTKLVVRNSTRKL